MPSKRAQRFVRKVDGLAAEIERWNDPHFSWCLRYRLNAPWVLQLPHMLRRYSLLMRNARKFASPQSHLEEAEQRCVLIDYVKKITGRFYDSQLSEMIGAVLGNDQYTVEAHSKWRRTHYGSS
jgi:hypothetical protein